MPRTGLLQQHLYFGIMAVFLDTAAGLQCCASPSLPVSGLGFWDCTLGFPTEVQLCGVGDGGGSVLTFVSDEEDLTYT